MSDDYRSANALTERRIDEIERALSAYPYIPAASTRDGASE